MTEDTKEYAGEEILDEANIQPGEKILVALPAPHNIPSYFTSGPSTPKELMLIGRKFLGNVGEDKKIGVPNIEPMSLLDWREIFPGTKFFKLKITPPPEFFQDHKQIKPPPGDVYRPQAVL